MALGFAFSQFLPARWRPTHRGSRPGALVVALSFVMSGLAQLFGAPSALAQEQAAAPAGTLQKFVILSRHGVRSPIPSPDELKTWTASTWPIWRCPTNDNPNKVCDRGQLTPQGRTLAEQMGTYYRIYLANVLPVNQCPAESEVFFLADLDERTKDTGLALLRGFQPTCDIAKYFHTATPPPPNRIFHTVRSGGRCKLDAARAERAILDRAGGSLSNITKALANELRTAQTTLRCCQRDLCSATSYKCGGPLPATCALTGRLPTCPVRRPDPPISPTEVQLGGALRVASTFAELLLLEYANNFGQNDVGWGRIPREQLTRVFRLHTSAFDLEQRAPYVAALQGSMLLRKIQLALKDETDGRSGTAPSGAKFVAYVGHDTNIANLGGMLELSWQQPGYQKDQTPPAGALTFELREDAPGIRNVYVSYAAQSLEDMRNLKGDHPVKSPVSVPSCSTTETGFPCRLDRFDALVNSKLDPDCSQ